MSHRRIVRFISILTAGVVLASSHVSFAQVTQQQVDAQLRGMSPQEIDEQLKKYGITRDEAESRAKSMGLDVGSYLKGLAADAVEAKTPVVKLTAPETPLPPDADIGVQKPTESKKWHHRADGVPYFGYDVFEGVPSAFEPTAAGPADPEYLIGPEDGLRLVVWGQAEFQYDLTVDKEGRIFIPNVGQIIVSGMTLEKAYNRLLMSMSRAYSGLAGSTPTVWMDLSLSRLRPKRIFILGEVRKPGGYTVHSYATIFNSLYSIGGPTVKGSLREVRLLRNGKTVSRVDLYDYFTGSETTNDVRVQTNDQIFVPVRGKTVSIVGQVNRPAVFELLPNETFEDLLKFAGGFTAEAYVERVKIRRILPPQMRVSGSEERIEMDVDYSAAVKAKRKIELQDGDEISVRNVLEDLRNYVTISGAVYRPGTYQLERYSTLQRVIAAADSFRREVYQGRAEISRVRDDQTRYAFFVNLEDALKPGEKEIPLQPLDFITVYSKTDITPKDAFFEVRGSVRAPGSFPLADNTSVLDALFKAKGFLDDANRSQVFVVRRRDPSSPIDTMSYSITVPVRFWKTETEPDRIDTTEYPESTFRLQRHDIVVVRPNVLRKPQELVTVSGEVRNPGMYALTKRNVRLSDILKQAGGLTQSAHSDGATIRRGSEFVRIDLTGALRSPAGDEDVVLQNGDNVIVPLVPNTVRVEGEVGNPGLYGYVKGRTLFDYVERAGGLSDSAQHVYLQSPNGETRRFSIGWVAKAFESDPKVLDGSSIRVSRRPPDPEGESVDVGATIKDIFAILASAVTVMVLARQL